MLAHMLVPGLPESASGTVYQHQRHQLALTRLHQGEGLIAFVHCAEPAWEQREGIRVPDEDELTGEEILEGDELLVLANNRVGGLLPRQTNVGPEALLQASALVSGLHNPRARAGDDHEARLRDLAAELHRLLVFGPTRLRPGGAEHGDFAHVRVRRKELECETQFRSEEHTSELQSPMYLVCRLLLEKTKQTTSMPGREASFRPAVCRGRRWLDR